MSHGWRRVLIEETNLRVRTLLFTVGIQISLQKVWLWAATWWESPWMGSSRSCSQSLGKQEHPTWVQDAQTGSQALWCSCFQDLMGIWRWEYFWNLMGNCPQGATELHKHPWVYPTSAAGSHEAGARRRSKHRN